MQMKFKLILVLILSIIILTSSSRPNKKKNPKNKNKNKKNMNEKIPKIIITPPPPQHSPDQNSYKNSKNEKNESISNKNLLKPPQSTNLEPLNVNKIDTNSKYNKSQILTKCGSVTCTAELPICCVKTGLIIVNKKDENLECVRKNQCENKKEGWYVDEQLSFKGEINPERSSPKSNIGNSSISKHSGLRFDSPAKQISSSHSPNSSIY